MLALVPVASLQVRSHHMVNGGMRHCPHACLYDKDSSSEIYIILPLARSAFLSKVIVGIGK